MPYRIAMIGAGSLGFSYAVAKELCASEGLRESTFVLMDVDAGRLALSESRIRTLVEEAQAPLAIETTLDRRRALAGCDFVITSCEKNRERYWNREGVDSDEGVPPLDWGEETWVIPGAGIPKSPVKGQATESHYAVFPEEIPRRLILSMCPPGGLVLDPFAGAGTTLAAAEGVGRSAIGFDLDVRNAEVARERVGMFLNLHLPSDR